MKLCRPFRALRPEPDLVSAVASVPYDVVSTAEARALAAGNPLSLLHVTRPEIDLAQGDAAPLDDMCAQARRAFDRMRAEGVLVREEAPCLFLYRLVMGGWSQTGILGLYSVDAYEGGRIVKHELTRPDKEEDRTRHILALEAQAEPVFLIHRPHPAVAAIAEATARERPLYDFTAVDGVRHTVWRIAQPEALVGAFGGVEVLYIADGHHRAAAAANIYRMRRGACALAPDDPARWLLAVAFPTDQVRVMPYHRLLHDLGGRTPEQLVEAVRAVAEVRPAEGPAPADAGTVASLLAGGRWHHVALEPVDSTPMGRLAPEILQRRVLAPVLGIANPRTDPRISFVGGIRGTVELERRVGTGEALAAFAMPAVTPEELLAVADAGLIMPPKSTWFEPKLRSGLGIYAMDEAEAG